MKLEIHGVGLKVGPTIIVHDTTILVAAGEMAGLIGPNGSGKSTLLRAVYRHLRPWVGTVAVGGHDVWQSSPQHAARRTAAVPQERLGDMDVSVRDMVAMGRIPHKSPFQTDTAEDLSAVSEALEKVGLLSLEGRKLATLSGGEMQRVLIARALAQRSAVLVLDEPTNHLDVRHQLELLELLRTLGLTTLAALHDLNLAAGYCDRLHVLDGGRLVASGSPAEVLTETLLADVFSVGASITTSPRTGKPVLSFHPLEAATWIPTPSS
ncbi:MAG: ABC transporter ATP-binding protein [Pseudonocardiaceae bacterium]